MVSKKCKNYDGSKKMGYYKGDEPSPKGLGFCAKYEIEGKERKGKDRNLWKVKNGRWVKITKPKKSTAPKKSTKPKTAAKKSTKPKTAAKRTKKIDCRTKKDRNKAACKK